MRHNVASDIVVAVTAYFMPDGLNAIKSNMGLVLSASLRNFSKIAAS
jgi:hypothetical protein